MAPHGGGAQPLMEMSFSLMPITDDELTVASVLCFTVGFLLCFFAYR